MIFNRLQRVLIICVAFFAVTTYAATTTEATSVTTTGQVSALTDYIPKIHGVVRTRWEGEFGDGFAQRFQVRNARVSVEGNVLPDVSYFVRIDACDQGKMLILDAWTRWGFAKQWHVQAGQFRVPFAVDCFRGPGSYYFANRSFLGRRILNMRAVGAQLTYKCATLPLTIAAGVFNSTEKSNHDTWQRNMTYAVKTLYKIDNVTFAGSYLSMEPDVVRINMIGAAVTWQTGRWIVEGEYEDKYYTGNAYNTVHAWNVFASYAIPLMHVTFNQLSFQARFDGMTDHSKGKCNDEGLLITDECSRRRITVGSTLAFMNKPVRAAIRLNYEKYFYDSHDIIPQGSDDKIVAELVVKF